MIANHKGEIPVVVLLLPFLAGISCGLSYLSPNNKVLISLLILSGIAFLFLNFTYNQLNIYKMRWIGGSLIAVILFLMGWVITATHNELNRDDHFSKQPAQYVLAHINSEPIVKNDLTRFTANITHNITKGKAVQSSGKMLITIKDELAQNLFYGEEILIPATYAPVDPPFNPAEFNYKKYLANKNIYYQLFLYLKQYKIVSTGKGNRVITYALQLRQSLVKKLKLNMQDTTCVAVASTLILGYKADMSNDILQAYSKTGTIHILSVSGGHVAIIYLLLSWALGFLNVYKQGKLTKALIIIALIWAYALLTGFSPAVCRAAVMISLIIGGKAYNRYINTLNLLAVSAFALLLYDPFLLTDVGFQLSYLAVAGLIVFQPIVYKWFSFKNQWVSRLWLACSVSIAAQTITFPLSAFYFHQFPVYFLLSNLLIIIPVSIIMYCGLLLLALPQMPVISNALGYILQKSILLMNKGLSFIEHVPFASINKIWINNLEYILLYAIIITFFYFMYDKKAWLIKLMAVCLLILSVSISIKKFKADSTQNITFLNLRKHSGIILKDGDEGVVLTDLPETDKNFQYSVKPCLDSSRITQYHVYNFNNNIRLPYLIKQNNLLQFLNKTLLILNENEQLKSIPQRYNINYLFIANNASIDTGLLKQAFGALIIDASNSNRYINHLQPLLKTRRINYRTLKRNNSIALPSN